MLKHFGSVLSVMVLCGAVQADEADAIKLVEQLGGTITRDDKQAGKPVVGVAFNFDSSPHLVGDADLKRLTELKQLTLLKINGARVTDAGLKELKGLKNLKELYLVQTAVTDAGVKELKGLKQLTTTGFPA